MRRFVLTAALLALVGASAGCSILFGSVNRNFAEASKAYAEVVFPEYDAYLDGDATLSANDRRIRKDTIAGWRALIDAALQKEK